MKLSSAVQESLIALLCYDDSPQSKAIRAMVSVKSYDPFFRELAQAADEYIARYHQPPGEHTFDLVEALGERRPDDKEVFERIYHSILQTKDSINRDYILARAGYFVRNQRMKGTIAEAIKVLQTESETAVDQAEALFSNLNKNVSDLTSSGLLLNDPNQALSFLDTIDEEVMPMGVSELDKLNLGPARKQLWMLIAATNKGKSITKDCRIWSPDHGYRPMGDYLSKTEGGFAVFGVSKEDSSPKITKTLKVFPSGRKQICRIKLRSGRILKGFSDTHPILTWRGWVPCSDLRPGDFTFGSSHLPLCGKSTQQERDECYAIGLFLGDGCLVSGEPRLCVHQEELSLIAQASRIIGSNPRLSFRGKGLEAHYRKRDFAFFTKWGVERKLSKRRFVPEKVFAQGEEAVAACLAGLFDTDGSVYRVGEWTRLEITTASYRLSEDLLTMLNVLGIYAARRFKRIRLGEKQFKAWTVYLNDAESLGLFYRRVGLYGYNAKKWEKLRKRRILLRDNERGQFFKRFPYHVLEEVQKNLAGANRWSTKSLTGAFEFAGFGSQYVKRGIKLQCRVSPIVTAKLAEYCDNDKLKNFAKANFVFDEIVSIKWVGIEKCWDMSTEDDTESFLAEHVFTHNTWCAVHKGKTALRFGKRVLHITLEMSEAKVAQRYIHSLFAVSKREVKNLTLRHFQKDDLGRFLRIEEFAAKKRPHLLQSNIRKVLLKKLKYLKHRPKLIIKQFPTGALTIAQLKGYLDHLEGVHNFLPDLVLLDYVDLMEVDPKNKRNELGKLYVDMRGLAVERNIAVATYSQSNRLGMSSKLLDLGKIAEDISKTHTADTVITFNQTDAEQELGLARLFVAKAREEVKHMQVLISQSYGIGQFCIDSAMMETSRYWRLIDEEDDKGSAEESEDDDE